VTTQSGLPSPPPPPPPAAAASRRGRLFTEKKEEEEEWPFIVLEVFPQNKHTNKMHTQ